MRKGVEISREATAVFDNFFDILIFLIIISAKNVYQNLCQLDNLSASMKKGTGKVSIK